MAGRNIKGVSDLFLNKYKLIEKIYYNAIYLLIFYRKNK